jgi:hypothetical protein
MWCFRNHRTASLPSIARAAGPSSIWFVTRHEKRQKTREKAFQANWDANNFQLEWFKAELNALLCHTGFIEVMTDASAPRSVRIRSRNPQAAKKAMEEHLNLARMAQAAEAQEPQAPPNATAGN